MRADRTWTARRRMVRQQLFDRGITDPRTLAAMATIPRHLFVSPGLARAAYDDAPLPVGEAQTISQPFMVALMSASLLPRRTHRVLEIGTGSGYQTAILAHLVRRVYTVERLPSLAEVARQRLESLGYRNVEYRVADGSLGWPEAAPFDCIVVTAAAPLIPAPLIDQLSPMGRMAVPVGDRALQELIVGVNGNAGLEVHRAGGCRFVPLIGAHAFPD